MNRSADKPEASAFPLALIAWAGLGVALHVGIARFTYGVMLPALQRDLALDYLGGGALNAVHLLGYLAGTLAAPALARTLGMPLLSRYVSLATAAMGIGQLLGPLAAGAAADRFGIQAVALFAFSIYAVGAALAALDAWTVGRESST